MIEKLWDFSHIYYLGYVYLIWDFKPVFSPASLVDERLIEMTEENRLSNYTTPTLLYKQHVAPQSLYTNKSLVL